MRDSSHIYIGYGMYLVSHSYGHYVAGTELLEPGSTMEERMPAKDFVFLSAILSICPFTGASCLKDAGKTAKRTGDIAAATGLGVLVGIYAFLIRRPCYALLYINIAIMLPQTLVRMIGIGYTKEGDVEFRSKPFTWLKFYADLLVLCVLVAEPVYCDSFMSDIGGHFLFDISLLLQLLANSPALSTQTEVKKKVT